MDLLTQRQTVVDNHKKLEKTRGSGWHPADLGSLEREIKQEMPLSERPVAIQDDDQIFFVGPCVAVVRAALESFVKDVQERPDVDLIGHGIQYQRIIAKGMSRLLTQTDQFCIPAREWNCVSSALAVSGIQCVMTPAEA